MEPPYVINELNGLSYFCEHKDKDFLVLYANKEFEFCLCMERCELPIVGVEPIKIGDTLSEIREYRYPNIFLKGKIYESILYKRHINEEQLYGIRSCLEQDRKSYADEQDPSYYRYQWALDNLKVVEQLKQYVGQTVLISLNRAYDLMGMDHWEDISDDEYYFDMCLLVL